MTSYDKMTKAELIKQIKKLQAQPSAPKSAFPPTERDRLVHELQVHQTELETQNDELRLTHQLLEESRDRYADLYDFSPVGYVTLNAQAIIQEINLTGATMLGIERTSLIGIPFSLYVAREEIGNFHTYLWQCKKFTNQMTFELTLAPKGLPRMPVQLTTVAVQRADEPMPVLRMTMQNITERKRTEEALRASKERYLTISNLISDYVYSGMLYADGTAQTEWITGAFEQITGYTVQEIQNRQGGFASLVHPDDLSKIIANQSRLFANQSLVQDYRIFTKDGQIHWLHDYMQPIARKSDSDPLHILGAVQDITERKRAEEALRASEEKYRVLIESSDALIALVDAEGRFQFANDQAAHSVGLAPAELIGKTLREIFTAQVAEERLKLVQQVFETNAPVITEIKNHTGDGWLHNRIQPIRDSAGQAVMALFNAVDITPLKTVQAELVELNRTLEQRVQERTAQVQDLYDNAPCGYHSLDPNGNFVLINQTELNWLGYAREEILGLNIRGLLAPDSVPIFETAYPEFKKRGWSKNTEVTMTRKDGSLLPVIIDATAVYDTEGNFVMTRSSMFDHTERHRTEQALRASEAALRVSRDELGIANLKLIQAARMKDEFLAMMSHELRTPLNAVLGLAESLEDQLLGPLNEKQIQALITIEASGRHLLALINDILDLAKIEAGAVRLDRMLMPVKSTCDASLAFIRESALKKRIQVTMTHDIQVQWISADARRFKQMLVNLLSNAVKFTPANGRIGLDIVGDEQAGVANFTVWDNGIGIASEQMPRLFKPFVQLDSALNRQYNGTGLGLALVAQMAEMHGGSITVESKVDHGSRFTITLPWHNENRPDDAALANPQNGAASTNHNELDTPTSITALASPNAGAPLILLAEDREENIFAVCNYLNARGYHVSVARHGGQALDLARAEHPTLILMDIQMPVLDGLEAIRRLRHDHDPAIANIPIIALTALVMPGDRERCLTAGANEYFAKPVNFKQLLATITRFIEPLSKDVGSARN